MLKEIYIDIIEALQKAGVVGDISFGKPPQPDQGDVAFACFVLAKQQNKNPAEVAKQIADQIDVTLYEGIDKVEALGPYVNFYLSIQEISREVLMSVIKDGESFGTNNLGENKKVLIEYPSQNTHKEFHIGHLRNVCIGNSLVNLYKKSGYQVLPINYINDFGAHVVKCLWGINKFHNGNVPKENIQRWLGEVYAEASNYIKEHDTPEIKEEVTILQNKLEARDPEIWQLFLQTRDASLDGFTHIHQELGITHLETILESEVKDEGQKIVDELLEKNIAKIGDGGAIIFDLSSYNLDIALARKSSGAGVYLTSDLALVKRKFKQFDIDESINVTGIEQDFYFKQLYKVLQLAGFDKKMTHIGYGLVTLPDGKMSSRLGNVVLYEELRDKVAVKLKKEITDRYDDWTAEEIDSNVVIITQAVLKFTLLKHEASKNIVFDFNEATSFDGYSAPYVLYVIARINSMVDKGGDLDIFQLQLDLLSVPQEKALLMQIATYSDVIMRAVQEYNPAIITKFCFDLAQKYNDFYHHCKVIDDDNKEMTQIRLLLSRVVRDVMQDALHVLSIDTVERM